MAPHRVQCREQGGAQLPIAQGVQSLDRLRRHLRVGRPQRSAQEPRGITEAKRGETPQGSLARRLLALAQERKQEVELVDGSLPVRERAVGEQRAACRVPSSSPREDSAQVATPGPMSADAALPIGPDGTVASWSKNRRHAFG